MDNNKLVIGFVVLLAAFLAFPIVAGKMRGQNPATTTAAGSGTTPAAVVSGAPAKASADPVLNDPPLLNEQNLTGSEWQVNVDKYKIKVTLAAGGIAYATHPMAKALTGLDYVEGHWRVQYDRIFVNANLGGNDISIELRIAGKKVFSVDKKGKASEVKRF